jgi:hypothetical protein
MVTAPEDRAGYCSKPQPFDKRRRDRALAAASDMIRELSPPLSEPGKRSPRFHPETAPRPLSEAVAELSKEH